MQREEGKEEEERCVKRDGLKDRDREQERDEEKEIQTV